MCRIYDSDQVRLWATTTRRCRKPRKCEECGRTIAPGEKYQSDSGLWEGAFERHSACAQCAVLAEWLVVQCGGYIYGEVVEEILEHAQEYRDRKLYRAWVLAGKWSHRNKGWTADDVRALVFSQGDGR